MPSTSGMLTNEKAGMADCASDDKVTGSMDRAEPELLARGKSQTTADSVSVRENAVIAETTQSGGERK